MKSTKAIRKELAKLIEEKQKACTTEQQKNKAVNDARQEINKKYGFDWRMRDYNSTDGKISEPNFYEGHEFGEHWMD